MKVSGVVVSHGHAAELERSLPALEAQVDELVVVANIPDSVRSVPAGVRVLENRRPRSLAANVNAGTAATTGEYVLASNPDAVPEPGVLLRPGDDELEPVRPCRLERRKLVLPALDRAHRKRVQPS